jgi:V/A-type H+-transporting ATPase subunit C
MNNKPGNAYLSTRLDMLASRLLAFDELATVLEQDVPTIVARINRAYAHGDDRLDDSGLGAGRFLGRRMFADFQMILRPFHANDYRFLKQAMRWFELVNIKVLIRGKFNAVPESALHEQLSEMGSFADVPLRRLVETDDPLEMLRMLEQTPYGAIVRQARRVYEEQGHELFSLDSAIDRNFFMQLSHRALFLKRKDQALLKPVLGGLMDRFNLLWLLRFRFSYGLSAAKSYYLLSANGLKLDSARLMQLARLDSPQAVVAQLPDTLRQVAGETRSVFELEQLMEFYSLSAAARGLYQSDSLLVRCFSYLMLREAEARYLNAIVKGKNLGFDDELIRLAVGGAG